MPARLDAALTAVDRRLGDALSITTGTSPAPRRAVQIGLAAGVFLAVANITLLMALREAPLT